MAFICSELGFLLVGLQCAHKHKTLFFTWFLNSSTYDAVVVAWLHIRLNRLASLFFLLNNNHVISLTKDERRTFVFSMIIQEFLARMI